MVTNHQHIEMLIDRIHSVKARVGFVEDGSTFASPHALIMSGA